MTYLYLKALHMIGFVSWFAGLFYIVRLYIYHAEAAERPEAERKVLQAQLELMAARLWKIITWPAMVITLVFGFWLLSIYGFDQGWVHIKLTLVFGLVLYHLSLGRIRKAQAAGTSTWTPKRLRYWNEVATLFLVAIIFTAVFKSGLNALWGLLGLVAFGVVLSIAIRLYRRVREGGENKAKTTEAPTT